MTPEQEPITAHRWIVAGAVLTSSLFFVGFPLGFLLRRGTEPGEVELSVD